MKVTLEELLDVKLKAGARVTIRIEADAEDGRTFSRNELTVDGKTRSITREQALRGIEILEAK